MFAVFIPVAIMPVMAMPVFLGAAIIAVGAAVLARSQAKARGNQGQGQRLAKRDAGHRCRSFG
jgi:hypothetical protein